MDPEWCPYVDVSVVVKLFDHRGGSQKSRFLHFVKLRADHHCVPAHGQSLPAVSEHCLRRTSWRTWEKPRVGALIRATPPAQSPSPEAGGSPRLFVPPTTRGGHTTGPRLQQLDMIWNPRSPGPQDYRAPRRRSSSERGLRDISLDPSRAPTYWLRVDPGPHACYLYRQKRFLGCAGTMRGSCPHEEKLEAFDSASPFSTLSLSAEGRVIQETLLIMTLKRFPSVVLVMLCLCLTRRPDQNTTVAPCNMAVNDLEVRRVLTCGCPQCSLGPSTPERSTHCLVPCYPQYEFPLGTREVNLLPFMGVPMVCAVPFCEVVPFCVELADVYSSLVSSLSFAVLGTELDIFCRRVDPPRGIEVEGRIPAQGANRPGVTESKKGIPARGLNPLSPTMLESRMIAENCPT